MLFLRDAGGVLGGLERVEASAAGEPARGSNPNSDLQMSCNLATRLVFHPGLQPATRRGKLIVVVVERLSSKSSRFSVTAARSFMALHAIIAMLRGVSLGLKIP